MAVLPPRIPDSPTSSDWIQIPAPKPHQRFVMRTLVLLGVVALGVFLYWFLDRDFIGFAPLYWALAIAFGYKILRILHEWYHYVGIRTIEPPELTRQYRVDMLTTFYEGEPYDMLLETLEAMVNVRYPHTTYLCDEANDPFLKQKCAELGVVHVYRGTDKSGAKAGNINYTLRHHATGEIAIILDPDHKPIPEFIDRVLPYFEQEDIGYVQSVQAYKNRNESFIAKGAAQQTYHFYGPMMMSMNSYGTVQAIGANCAFRRAALDSIGGHAIGLSEDMHTAMRLHAAGWKSVYVAESLTRGLVPATLSSYYKQQLKWSRGTFDLLFRVLPKLTRHLTWRQLIHYLTIPLFFLSGLIALIDIAVPILALVLARSPWYVELGELVQYTLPLLTMVVLIRQYAQHWTLEEHEGGFHFLGGALLFGSWWVTLTGFVYAILNIKVPYIPTPKGDELNNEWRITRPNVVAILLSLAAIVYGLSIDWSPYSFVMAFFAGVNVFMLTFLTLISQQKLLGGLYRRLYHEGQSRLKTARRQLYVLRHRLLYRAMRNRWIASLLIFTTLAVSLSFIDRTPRVDLGKGVHNTQKVHETFLLGVPADQTDSDLLTQAKRSQVPLGLPLNFLQLSDSLISPSQSAAELRRWQSLGYLPMIDWVPAQGLVNAQARLLAGELDSLLRREALVLRQIDGPVLIRLAPMAATKGHAWSLEDSAGRQSFIPAWQHVVDVFRAEGVANVIWVWQQSPQDSLMAYYPGERYVDYVGLDLFQTLPMEGAFPAFDSLYLPLRNQGFPHPVVLSPFRSPTVAHAAWLSQTLSHIQVDYPEIQGILFASMEEVLEQQAQLQAPKQIAQQESLRQILQRLRDRQPSSPLTQGWLANKRLALGRTQSVAGESMEEVNLQSLTAGASTLTYNGETFQWMVGGKALDLRGVVYNPAQDWRDGHTPLTRNKLMRDFAHIKAMGANTISRYRPGIYDENLLRAADDANIHVLYGFWFEPWIDYHADTVRVNQLVANVLDRVQEEHHHQAIIGWGLGNETWERLSYHFDPAYLFLVRRGYMQMLDRIAKQIRAIDADRPVYTELVVGEDLPIALQMLTQYAPHVDMPGLHVFYTEHLETLSSQMDQHWSDRPFFIAEFGIDGHWDERYTQLDEEGFLKEPSDFEKGSELLHKWETYLAPLRHQQSLGALAYCWQDRFDGTMTWYGLSDYDGNLKPGYFALKEAWTGEKQELPLADAFIQSPLTIPDRRRFLNFRGVSPNNLQSGLQYEWSLVKQHSNEPIGSVEEKRKYNLALVQLPLPPGGYRLYLRIRDGKGHVVTASEGFPVYDFYNGQR